MKRSERMQEERVFNRRASRFAHHVPEEVCHPVNQRADPTDELEVLGGGHALLDEVEDEAGGDEGHGKDDTDRHHSIDGGGQPEGTTRRSHNAGHVTGSNVFLYLDHHLKQGWAIISPEEPKWVLQHIKWWWGKLTLQK